MSNAAAATASSSNLMVASAAVLRLVSEDSSKPELNAPTKKTRTRPMIMTLTNSSTNVVPA